MITVRDPKCILHAHNLGIAMVTIPCCIRLASPGGLRCDDYDATGIKSPSLPGVADRAPS